VLTVSSSSSLSFLALIKHSVKQIPLSVVRLRVIACHTRSDSAQPLTLQAIVTKSVHLKMSCPMKAQNTSMNCFVEKWWKIMNVVQARGGVQWITFKSIVGKRSDVINISASRMPWRREAPTSASLLMPRNHRFLNSSVRPQVMVATASISGARSSIGNVVDSKGSGIVVDYMETQCCRLADYVHSSTLIISHV